MKNEILEFMSEFCIRGEEKGSYSPLQFMRIGVPDLGEKKSGRFFNFYILVNVDTGERLSDAYFDDHGDFVDGVAPVKVKGEWGYIKENGVFLVEPVWGYTEACNSENGILIATRKDDKIDLRYALTGDLLEGEAGFDSVEPFYEKPDGTADAYIVERDGVCGLLSCSGEWVFKPERETMWSWSEMDCVEISAVTEDLAHLKFAMLNEEIRRISTNEIVATGIDFSFEYDEEYGIIYCLDEEGKFKVYHRSGNDMELLFTEPGEGICVHSPDIVLLFNDGETIKWSMYSAEKKEWLYRDLDEIDCCNKPGGYPFYLLKRENLKGIASITGELLVPIEVEDFCYHGKDILELATATGIGVYSLKAKKWLFLPQGDVIKPLIYPGAFVVGEMRRGFIKSYYVWRYFVNERFISRYSFKICNEFKEVDGEWRASVKKMDGRKGWIDLEGRFYEEIKESGEVMTSEEEK